VAAKSLMILTWSDSSKTAIMTQVGLCLVGCLLGASRVVASRFVIRRLRNAMWNRIQRTRDVAMIDGRKMLGRVVWLGLLAVIYGGITHPPAHAQETEAPETAAPETEAAVSAGLADLDEALRLKVSSNGLRELNKVIQSLEIAIDKGLDTEDHEFAKQMLSDSLMERASTLMQVINSRSIRDQRFQKIRSLVTSDLRRVLDYDDPLPTAHFMLAKLMTLPGGDPHEARSAVNKFLKSEDLPNDQHAEALFLRARLTKDETKALADMEAAIELAPENTAYRLARSMFLRRANKLDESLASIDEVIRRNPADGNALILQGEIYRQQKRVEEALASFDKASEVAPEAPEPYQKRGEIYRELKDYEKAIEQFTKVLELQPGFLLTLIHRAEAYMASKKLVEALADIVVVLEKQPSLVAAHHLRAKILIEMDRLEEAIVEMEQVSAAMPDQLDLKMQLALYYLADRQSSKAIATYSDVLDQNKDNFLALQSRGDAYLNMGKHAEAIADFSRAVKLQPENATLLNNLAWVLATSPEDGLRDGKRAVELASKACELTDYKTPHILSTLAASFAEDGEFENAIKWSQQAVDLDDPEHGEQLAKELDSYREGQPWREKQSVEEKASGQPLEDSLQGPAAPAAPRLRQ